MKAFFFFALLAILLTNCSNPNTNNLIDVILVNGKGEIQIGDDQYKNCDSIRVEIEELTNLTIDVKGFEKYSAVLFPNCALKNDKNKIGKIYITLSNYQSLIDRKENQRCISLFNKIVSLPIEECYGFENEEEFYNNINKTALNNRETNVSQRFNTYKYLQVVKGLKSYSVFDYLNGDFLLMEYKNSSMFGSPQDLHIDLAIEQTRIVSIEGKAASLQLYGKWNLLNCYDEIMYSYPIKTYTSIDNFVPESIHGSCHIIFESSGITKTIDEALEASFFDFFNSKKTQYFLNKKNTLHNKTTTYNTQLSTIRLKNAPKATAKTSLADNLNSTVLVNSSDQSNFGSGSIISTDGYILTNYHVVSNMENIQVTLNSGKLKQAKLIRSNLDLDLALIKIDCNNCTTFSFNENYMLGESVFDIGTPLELENFNSVFSAIVSKIRPIYGHEYIQTNSVSSNGMSGGPLINSNGEQIGLRVWGLKDKNGNHIYGFCYYIPISEAFKGLNITAKTTNSRN